jgi:carotenoid 1,2-hydratase
MESFVSAPGRAIPHSRPVSGGGQCAPGSGGADRSPVGTLGGGQPGGGPRFDAAVAPNGYAWWYVDAFSDDGHYGITLIAFLGSVFSPYYARARRAGTADPLDHCALNVSLYTTHPAGGRRKRWTLTERRRHAVHCDRDTLTIGPSALHWDGSALSVRVDELTVPLPSRVRGTVRVHPQLLTRREYPLDDGQRHHWWPLAPSARVEVDLQQPALRWSGQGYFDLNHGQEPLEDAFESWNWSRAAVGRDTCVLYDVERRHGGQRGLALRFARSGESEAIAAPPQVQLPASLWRVARATRSQTGIEARVVKTLEDGPFYARSRVATGLLGRRVTAMHESLSLKRFAAPWVQMLLPFRMPRAR